MHPKSVVTITRVKHGQHATPDYAPSDLAETAARTSEPPAAEPSRDRLGLSGSGAYFSDQVEGSNAVLGMYSPSAPSALSAPAAGAAPSPR